MILFTQQLTGIDAHSDLALAWYFGGQNRWQAKKKKEKKKVLYSQSHKTAGASGACFVLVSPHLLRRDISTEKRKEEKKSVKIPRVVPRCLSAYIYIPIPSVVKSLLVRVDPITSQHSIITFIFRNLTPQKNTQTH